MTKTDAAGRALVKARMNDNQLALALGISRQAVGKWGSIPVKFIHKVAQLTGLPVTRILPSVFNPPQEKSSRAKSPKVQSRKR